MADFFHTLNGLEIFFLISAVIGGAFVLIRLVLQFIGAEISPDSGFDAHHLDSDAGFTGLSLHGLTSFFMMFGLVGLALYRQSEAGKLISLGGAILAGLISVWVIGKVFVLVTRLQSNGTLDITDTVGCTGTVYLNISKGGVGRVTVNVKNRLREYDAMADGGDEIPTGIPVRVVRVDARTLVVEKLQ
ncbi:MAG: hypothetical protein A4E57_04656 [Syntrophorhabdaceae bacterium PtaU1.Bin034]|nr:MAG: hypothetical protein A4E57_04656 [Syntrophorhabdaceae bacterium PtaU1.Bin034]